MTLCPSQRTWSDLQEHRTWLNLEFEKLIHSYFPFPCSKNVVAVVWTVWMVTVEGTEKMEGMEGTAFRLVSSHQSPGIWALQRITIPCLMFLVSVQDANSCSPASPCGSCTCKRRGPISLPFSQGVPGIRGLQGPKGEPVSTVTGQCAGYTRLQEDTGSWSTSSLMDCTGFSNSHFDFSTHVLPISSNSCFVLLFLEARCLGSLGKEY